jgi:predicted GIY-YIG superfamily endonuclease
MKGFCYVYILESVGVPEHFYVGLSDDLNARLAKHNAGGVSHTAKFKPWRIKTGIAFAMRERAAAFKAYLKTASGRTFSKKRL